MSPSDPPLPFLSMTENHFQSCSSPIGCSGDKTDHLVRNPDEHAPQVLVCWQSQCLESAKQGSFYMSAHNNTWDISMNTIKKNELEELLLEFLIRNTVPGYPWQLQHCDDHPQKSTSALLDLGLEILNILHRHRCCQSLGGIATKSSHCNLEPEYCIHFQEDCSD